MELNKLRENLASQVPLLVPDNYMMKLYNMKDEFPFEASSSSKGNYNYLQDFHHLDHQFQVNGSSSNPMFGVQNPCFDPYNDTTYTYEASTIDVKFYECKPLNAETNMGHGQVLDNFQGDSGYLNFPAHTSNPLDHLMGSSHRSATNFLPLDYQDIKPMNFVVPDEVSCIYNADQNGYYKKFGMNGKSRVSTLTRGSTYKGRKKSNVVKGQWTIEEDRLLIQLVEQYGVRKWSHIAQMLPGRIGKQCRERWHNHLRPDIKKDTWSEEEDKILIQAHAEIGNKWAEIAKRLPGRTENSIKNHWNATKRRQYSKRKCRSKYPRGSLLQEYIKSLNLDSTGSSTGRQRKNKSGNNNATSPNNMAASSTKSHTQQTQNNVGFSCANDRLVPNYDFNEDPDFCFDDNMFQEGCSIDSLLDDIPCAPVLGENNGDFDGKIMAQASVVADEEKDFEMEMQVDVDMGPVMESSEVKKELDLVEMISQVN
ncbi:transcription factor MYB98-like [Prunus yedoensis var. nudiflora]|uniref:Transcription factor MYB98-like n=1 Tax=Prunus yedoensis var. nudiflora TaxID=2094558 RepID=A0A314Y6B8_PRUYE|nr:transcription factor MYB98-like [Prunus yedoensis var. nudiflora]